jgi:hypothetical protein
LITLAPEEPAIIIEDSEKILVTADYHIGFEQELAEVGINIPSQTHKLQRRLARLLERVRPDRLIFLGDVKHSVPKILFEEWEDVPLFFEAILKLVDEVEVVPGNHDGDLEALIPRPVKILPVSGVVVGIEEKVALLHGHAWPDFKLLSSDYMIIGHSHPVIHLRDPSGYRITKPVWFKANCNGKILAHSLLRSRKLGGSATTEEIASRCLKLLVMPAFNDILGGSPINIKSEEGLLGPLFRSKAVNVMGGEVYLLDGTYIGRLSDLTYRKG